MYVLYHVNIKVSTSIFAGHAISKKTRFVNDRYGFFYIHFGVCTVDAFLLFDILSEYTEPYTRFNTIGTHISDTDTCNF